MKIANARRATIARASKFGHPALAELRPACASMSTSQCCYRLMKHYVYKYQIYIYPMFMLKRYRAERATCPRIGTIAVQRQFKRLLDSNACFTLNVT